jgi:hypothetical protein
MKVKETVLLIEENKEFEDFLMAEEFSDKKIEAAVSKVGKGLDVENKRFKKIGKIGGEQYSKKVQGSKKSYNELVDRANQIRKEIYSGAYKDKIPQKLTQLRNVVSKMRMHKKIVDKFATSEASKKEHEVAMKKLGAPARKAVAKEEAAKKRAKRHAKGEKAIKRSAWEKRVKDYTSGLASFKE